MVLSFFVFVFYRLSKLEDLLDKIKPICDKLCLNVLNEENLGPLDAVRDAINVIFTGINGGSYFFYLNWFQNKFSIFIHNIHNRPNYWRSFKTWLWTLGKIIGNHFGTQCYEDSWTYSQNTKCSRAIRRAVRRIEFVISFIYNESLNYSLMKSIVR